jgi:hypothetical protein
MSCSMSRWLFSLGFLNNDIITLSFLHLLAGLLLITDYCLIFHWYNLYRTGWKIIILSSYLSAYSNRDDFCFKKYNICQKMMAYACNSSYSGGRDQKDHSLKPAQANSCSRPYLADGVVQGEGPQFKPQSYFKKKICIYMYIYIYIINSWI